MRRFTLYMKPTCHLCHNAAALLEQLGPEYGFDFEQVDITQDTALFERFCETIPVLEDAGKPLVTTFFSEPVLRKALDNHLGVPR